MNFWQKLKKEKGDKPIIVLAPLADVTDPAFRRLIAKYGKPDVMYTEFISADGLFMGGYDALIKDLVYSESERPIVAQFFTSKPEMMEKAATLAVELGFDGVDINMGCPDKSVEKQGAGAGLIKTAELAVELIKAAKRVVNQKSKFKSQKLNTDKETSVLVPHSSAFVPRLIPVSVKTRIGYNKNELETWLPALLSAEPAVITIHARTRKEMSLVPARWEHVKRAVEIRDEVQAHLLPENRTLIIGNGDAQDVEHAGQLARETGADGVMLGRAIFGTPWLFANLSDAEHGRQIEHPDGALAEGDYPFIRQKLLILVEHTKLFEQLCSHKNFAVMKKHFKAYVSDFDGAKELRMKLMEAGDAEGVEKIIQEYLS